MEVKITNSFNLRFELITLNTTIVKWPTELARNRVIINRLIVDFKKYLLLINFHFRFSRSVSSPIGPARITRLVALRYALAIRYLYTSYTSCINAVRYDNNEPFDADLVIITLTGENVLFDLIIILYRYRLYTDP